MKLGEGLFGGLGFFAFGVEFEIGLEFGDGFVFLLHLLRDLSQGEVGGGVLGLNVDRIFRAEIGALIVFVVQIKLCDGEVFVDAFVVGLNSFDLGQFAMNGGAFGGIGRIACGGGVAGVGAGIVRSGWSWSYCCWSRRREVWEGAAWGMDVGPRRQTEW